MATFADRINYITHSKNLKLYLDLGMKLKKIHRKNGEKRPVKSSQSYSMTEIAISTCLTVEGEEEGYEPKIATQPLLESEVSEQEESTQHQKPSGSKKIVTQCKAASKAAPANKKQKSSKEQPIMEESKHDKNKNTDKTKKESLVRSNQTYSKRKQA